MFSLSVKTEIGNQKETAKHSTAIVDLLIAYEQYGEFLKALNGVNK